MVKIHNKPKDERIAINILALLAGATPGVKGNLQILQNHLFPFLSCFQAALAEHLVQQGTLLRAAAAAAAAVAKAEAEANAEAPPIAGGPCGVVVGPLEPGREEEDEEIDGWGGDAGAGYPAVW